MKSIQKRLNNIDFSEVQDFEHFNLKHGNMMDIVHLLMDAQLHRVPHLETREKSLSNIIYYLFYIEGIYSFNINMILFNEIKKNNIDISMDYENKGHSVTEFEDLYNVTLGKRLKYLRKTGYVNIANLCDTDIRNSIAHSDYYINGKGALILLKNKEKINYSTMESYIDDLQKFMMLFNTSFFHSNQKKDHMLMEKLGSVCS